MMLSMTCRTFRALRPVNASLDEFAFTIGASGRKDMIERFKGKKMHSILCGLGMHQHTDLFLELFNPVVHNTIPVLKAAAHLPLFIYELKTYESYLSEAVKIMNRAVLHGCDARSVLEKAAQKWSEQAMQFVLQSVLKTFGLNSECYRLVQKACAASGFVRGLELLHEKVESRPGSLYRCGVSHPKVLQYLHSKGYPMPKRDQFKGILLNQWNVPIESVMWFEEAYPGEILDIRRPGRFCKCIESLSWVASKGIPMTHELLAESLEQLYPFSYAKAEEFLAFFAKHGIHLTERYAKQVATHYKTDARKIDWLLLKGFQLTRGEHADKSSLFKRPRPDEKELEQESRLKKWKP